LEDGYWGHSQPFGAFGDHYSIPYSQSSGYDAGMNTMALALGDYNNPWTTAESSNSHLAAGCNDVSTLYTTAVSQFPENQTVWSGHVAPDQDLYSFGTLNQSFSYPSSADISQSLSYAISAAPMPSFMSASAAAVFSEQSILLEDARLNNADSQGVHTPITPHTPEFPESQSYTPSMVSDALGEFHDGSHFGSASPQPVVVASKKRRSTTVKKDQKLKVRSKQVKYNAGKVAGYMQVFEPEVKVKRPRTKEQRERTALNRRVGACEEHHEAHKGVSYYPHTQT
jgi:hypothetical protein